MLKGPIDFEKAMHGIHTRAKLEANYGASIDLQMLYRLRGLGTAKQLVNSPKVSDGYTRLYELGRLDLTVEALIVDNPQWHGLLAPEELERARKRLQDYAYTPRT